MAENPEKKQIQIPARPNHEGFYTVMIWVNWICPVCGGPRGEIKQVASYDGSRRLICDGWSNPCGHVDKYQAVIKEAITNGLNQNWKEK